MSSKRGTEDINLTAMIDLFSTMIIFLLMTAVWNQIDSLTTNVDNVSSSENTSNLPQEKKVMLSLTLLTDRVELSEDDIVHKVPLVAGDLDLSSLRKILDGWRMRYPNRKDVILHSDNKVPYRHLIKVFDFMIGNGWPDVGVNTQ